MKKTKLIALLLALAMLFTLTACGNTNAPAEAPAQEPAPADALTAETPKEEKPAEAEKPAEPEFILTFSDYNQENGNIGDWEKAAMAKIEEDSNGRIKFEPYFNGTMLEAMDTWSGTAQGMADISYYFITLSTGVQSVGEVFTQYYTFTAPTTPLDVLHGFRQVLETIPEIQTEANAANLTILDVCPTTGSVYCFNKEQNISSPADLKGMILQAQGHYTDALATVGASGESLYPSDWYTSLERGVVDALTMNWAGIGDMGFDGISESYLTFGENGGAYAGGCAYIMNLDTWNAMPEDLQQILKDGFQWLNENLVAADTEDSDAVREREIAAGKTIVNVPESEMQPWYDLAQISVDMWMDDCKAAGFDNVEEIYNTYVDIMKSF